MTEPRCVLFHDNFQNFKSYKGRSGHYKAWNCKERQKGKKGNGCMNRIIKEDALVQAVSEKLGADAVDRVQKVLVYKDRIEIK